MAGRHLSFSRASLFSNCILLLLFASAALALGWGTGDDELVGHLWLFRLAGAQNVRWFFEGGGCLSLLTGLAMLRRVLGNGVAAAIQDDGVGFNSLFVSRKIPWRDLRGVRLHQWRDWRGGRHDVLRVETASGCRDIPVSQLRAGTGEIAQWIRAANEARARTGSGVGRGRFART